MTRAEILNCLTDRPCDVCRFHESGKCERWNCVFEEKPDDAEDCEDEGMTREEASFILANIDRRVCDEELSEALDMAIEALSTEPCEDAISRQVIKEQMIEYGFSAPDMTVTEFVEDVLPVTPKQKVGYISIDDAMSVFDDYMCGDIDEAGAEIFLEMLKDKAESEDNE